MSLTFLSIDTNDIPISTCLTQDGCRNCFPPICANLLLKIGSTELIYIKYNLQTLNGYRKTIMSLFFYIGLGPRL